MKQTFKFVLFVIHINHRIFLTDCHDLPKRNRKVIGRYLRVHDPQEHLTHGQKNMVFADRDCVVVNLLGKQTCS